MSGALAKDIKLGSGSSSLCMLISSILLFLSWACFLVALIGSGWVKVRSIPTASSDVQLEHWVGLWEECHEYWGCKYLTTGEIGSVHRTTQAFVTLTFMAMYSSILLSLLYIFVMRLRQHLGVGLGLFVCRILAMICLLVAIVLWATDWEDTRYNNGDFGYDGDLHYAFGFAICSLIFEFIATIFMAMEVFVVIPQKSKAR